jgi:Transposase C of IS166 homeodomain
MSSGIASLPRDPAILIETIARLRAENEKLHATLGTLKGALYGAHSEWRDADEAQLALGVGDLAAHPVEPEPDGAARRGPALPKPVRSKTARATSAASTRPKNEIA